MCININLHGIRHKIIEQYINHVQMNNYCWRYVDLDPTYYIHIILRTCLFKIKLISRDTHSHNKISFTGISIIIDLEIVPSKQIE